MREKEAVSRRALLAAGLATTASLAGCSGSGDDSTETATPTASSTPRPTDTSTASPTPTQTATPEPTDTPTDTPTATPDPAPSLSEFEYPTGASQNGISNEALFVTHESLLSDVDSVTMTGEIDKSGANFEETLAVTNAIGSDAVSGVVEDSQDGNTESLWSPTDEDRAYVRMASASGEQYRIDNQGPGRNELLELFRTRTLLVGAEWSEATEVVEDGPDGYAVRYETAGVADEDVLKRLTFGNEFSEFAGTLLVSQDGHISEFTYDVTFETSNGTRQEDIDLSVENVDSTAVETPDWIETARAEGIQFSASVAEDRTSVTLEMVNGNDVPSGARLTLSDGQGRAVMQLSDPVTVGDTLSLGLSSSGELLVNVDGPPDDARQLQSFLRTTIRDRGFLLFVHSQGLQ
jgi:hypothetical protein